MQAKAAEKQARPKFALIALPAGCSEKQNGGTNLRRCFISANQPAIIADCCFQRKAPFTAPRQP